MNLATATKADLQAEIKRLQRSLQRSNAKVAAADKSLGSVETRNKALLTSLSEAKANLTGLEASLVEARKREKATAQILTAISSSPRDAKPVFETILGNALRLCGAHMGQLYAYDGEKLRNVAQRGTTRSYLRFVEERGPFRPVSSAIWKRVISQRRPVHLADLTRSSQYKNRLPGVVALVELNDARTHVAVPLLNRGRVVGVIAIYRSEVRPFLQKQIDLLATFANQAVIAIENVRLFKELQARNAELTDALEQQTATSEILRIISGSPTDTQPVFEAIVRSGARLFGDGVVSLRLVEGAQSVIVASTQPLVEAGVTAPFHLSDHGWPAVQAVLRREVVQIADVLAADSVSEEARRRAASRGFRAIVCAPMLRKGEAVGTINVTRRIPGMFGDKQVALLRTFADQAVIAIENARLFNETKEALEKQSATAEILKVISTSPTDTAPVFDTILQKAALLCDSTLGGLGLYDGEKFQIVAANAGSQEVEKAAFQRGPYTPDPGGFLSRALKDGQPYQIADLRNSDGYRRRRPYQKLLVEDAGIRSYLFVPMLKNDRAVGGIALYRSEVRPFTDDEIALLRTFSDQAVIAIENVRLFKELQARNAEITEALERQTATAHILEIISRSPTDIQTVLDAVASSAGRLCEANDAVMYRVDGDVMRVAAHVGHLPTAEARPVHARSVVAQAIRERRTIHVHDVSDPRHLEEYPDAVSAIRRAYKTILVAPLIREDSSIGAVIVRRDNEVRPFSDKQVALLETFAAQAVIAIENARLFKELQAQTEALSRSVNQLTALGEIGRAISSTLDLETVLQTIVSRARLLTGHSGSIYEYDQGARVFRIQAAENMEEEVIRAIRRSPIALGDGIVGRTGITREPTQIADILEPGFESGRKELLIRSGYRAMLAVPLLREGQLLGVLLVSRKTPGAFPVETVEILKTFATQSALAIQNARLFREIAEKGRQLEIANRHKSEFLANMSHELRTPLNAVIGFSEVLQQGMVGALNEKQNEYINYIHTSGSHLLSLINDILDLAKVEAGRMELDLAHFSVPMAIDNALTLVRERATRHGLTLESTLDPAVGEVDADERKFKQILLNLLSNAVKFTPEGGQITVTARALDATVEVSVTDNGVGIAPEDCEAVFEEFRQVGQDAERKAQGTGLGLALTKKFIELHGGRIWLTSTPGKGSTFSFTLPIHQPEVQATA